MSGIIGKSEIVLFFDFVLKNGEKNVIIGIVENTKGVDPVKKSFALFILLVALTVGLLAGCGDTPDGDSEHDYTATVIAPTCEAAGYTENVCSDCGDFYISDITDALGHDMQPIPDKAPTCTEDGHTGGVACARCDKVQTQPTKVDKTGHNYNTSVVEPTCEERGYTVYICVVCEDTYNADYVSAAGHTWSEADENGIKTCTVCQEKVEEKDEEKDDDATTLPTLIVTYVDVGQGDCILIRLGDCDILIDAGKPDRGTAVSSYLKSQNVDDIELMINTHLDNDHYGGLPQVLDDFVVEAFWGTGYKKSSSGITSLKNKVTAEGLTYNTPAVGTEFVHEGLTLTVISNGAGATNSNDSSIVVMLEYGEFKFLFTGDIGQKMEAKLVSEGADLACDVLKVGHHGSKTSSTAAFLAATGAKYAVICVGAGNSYKHPTSEALNNLKAAGMTVARTDLHGHVTITTDGSELVLPDTLKGASTAAAEIGVREVAITLDIELINQMLKRRYLAVA